MPEPRTNSNQAAPAASADVAVIGGGVVGCAVARKFALAGAKVVLLEKAPDILAGASKGNSALLHTGFDAPTGSLELQLMQRGYAEYVEIHDRLNLPLLQTGALVVAWTPEELAKLEPILQQGHANGVNDVAWLDRAETLEREPNLSPALLGSVWVPREHVIDPWSAPLAYLTQALVHGATTLFNAEVTGGAFQAGRWRLETTQGAVEATHVVNCAGLFGDRVEAMLLGEASFSIHPRKGQFVVFDKPSSKLFTSIILPVPTERTKGVVLARTIFGNVLVGPTAEEQDERDRVTVEEATLQSLIDKAVALVPALAGMPVNAVYAGLRPASDKKEYRVRHEGAQNFLTLGGIRSTGLTAALGLAAHAVDLIAAEGWSHAAIAEPQWTKVPNLAEHRERDWQQAGYDEIVCHCEMVTKREIEAAFAGPLPPGDLGGLRRRTRAAMGRCQGFYCGARLAELTEGRLATPLACGAKDGQGGHGGQRGHGGEGGHE